MARWPAPAVGDVARAGKKMVACFLERGCTELAYRDPPTESSSQREGEIPGIEPWQQHS